MPASVVLQARVPSQIADALPADIETLGLEGPRRQSVKVFCCFTARHDYRKARLVALGRSYDAFYDGEPAPVSEVTAALYPDDGD